MPLEALGQIDRHIIRAHVPLEADVALTMIRYHRFDPRICLLCYPHGAANKVAARVCIAGAPLKHSQVSSPAYVWRDPLTDVENPLVRAKQLANFVVGQCGRRDPTLAPCTGLWFGTIQV